MGSHTYKTITGDFLFLYNNEDIENINLVRISDDEFHLLQENKSVYAKLIGIDEAGKKINIELEGETFSVEIKDELDQQLEQMGFGSAVKKQLREIRSPMPGLVLEISVEDGMKVNMNDKVLILEAMKMENSILAPAEAVIKKILVKKGDAVEKGQLLIELE